MNIEKLKRKSKRILNYKILFLLFLLSCQTKIEKPNVIFILVDDLGWTDLGSYGSKYYQTPNIDKLAKKGIQFTNAYAASNVCSPTRASILTGKYPATLHLTDYIPGKQFPNAKLLPPKWKKYLDTSEVTTAEVFKNNGYKTAHIGKWHLGKDSIYWPENHGFDINIGGYSRGSPIQNKRKGKNGYFSPYGNPKLKDGSKDEYLTNRLAIEAKKFITKNKNTPFFLNFWLYSVHMPLQAKNEKIQKYESLKDYSKKHKNAVYAAMIEHMDEAIGIILKTLVELDLDKKTIIVFTSDNGGLVGNHKRFKESITSNFPLRSGKGDIYEGGVRVPCIFYYPNKMKPRVDDTPIISPDFLPTLINLTDLSIKKQTQFDGVSLASLLLKNEPLKSRPLFWHYPHYHLEGAVPYSAIRYNNYKLIHNSETNSLELYNLEKDIAETKNLRYDNEVLTQNLFSKLKQWKLSNQLQQPTSNPRYIENFSNDF